MSKKAKTTEIGLQRRKIKPASVLSSGVDKCPVV
jgi:hypothetical protein